MSQILRTRDLPNSNFAGFCGKLEAMKIVVCVKHVPDVDSSRRIEDGTIVRGEDDVLNELDENAIEAAVTVAEENGGEVVALTMGPEDAEDAVMRALQMGADRGVVVSDEELEGTDAIGTAKVLAAAIRKIAQDAPVDLVVTGMASLDGMTSMLPGALAAALQLPCLSLASAFVIEDGRLQISKQADGFDDVLAVNLPAVLSVTDQVNEPRFPGFQAMAAARQKPLENWTLADLGLTAADAGRIGQSGSGTEVLRADERPSREGGTVIQDTGDGGQKMAEFLKGVLPR